MTAKTKSAAKLLQNQGGLVSFIVTLIIMIILSLIVIGFSTLTRREQRQALDKQLQTQAFYAAESGVNDAVKALDAFFLTSPGVDPPAKTDCSSTVAPWNTLSPDLQPDQSVQYTCVLVNPTPPDVSFDEVGFDSKVAPLNGVDPATGLPAAFPTLTFSWQNKNANVTPDLSDCDSNSAPADGAFPAANRWGCSVGIMRVDLVPTPDSGSSRATLISNTMTVFLYPSSSASIPNVAFASAAGAGQGSVVIASCSGTPTVCTANIDVSARSDTKYMMRARGIYLPSQLKITSVGRNFRGAQVIIDATGKAQDVLRRIQVRKPYGTITNPLLADYTIESSDICKQFEFIAGASGSVTAPTGCPIN